ncbi:uncharacterized protein LOC126842537 isoform X4 [Adelges cooleyi]|uniref:uncharacterized protein LOC126842537 isoform X4 n=1 Tax=Adelges cooleyi TaxID=133065 RepID=UPI00217FFE10|nr:uncharacterized protein LOC126842537 isoform X4 [Adelges cooleyi]
MANPCERMGKLQVGITYDLAKKSKYYEFVDDIENIMSSLATEVFEKLGVSGDDETFNIAVKGLENFQQHQLNELSALVNQLLSLPDIDEDARSFLNDWIPGIKYQFEQKYYLKRGPNPQSLQNSYLAVLEHFVPGCFFVTDKFDKNDIKIKIADFCKNTLLYEIDCLNHVKKAIETYRKK